MAAELAPAKTSILHERYEHEYTASAMEAVSGGPGDCVHPSMIWGLAGAGQAGPEIAYLVARDIVRTWRAMGRIDPDLVLTCGNAGDVRKAILLLSSGRGCCILNRYTTLSR